MAQCPHCMTEIHDDASICPSCGAMRGVWGHPVGNWLRAGNFMLGIAAFLVVLGIALGGWVSSGYATTWFDGLIAFLFLVPFMLLFAALGFALRSIIPRLPQHWYR